MAGAGLEPVLWGVVWSLPVSPGGEPSVWPCEHVLGFSLDSNMEVYTGRLGPAGC